jgi:hypothetical protein
MLSDITIDVAAIAALRTHDHYLRTKVKDATLLTHFTYKTEVTWELATRHCGNVMTGVNKALHTPEKLRPTSLT